MFRVCLCHNLFYVPCSLVVTCWERDDLLALLCVMFSCVLSLAHNGILGKVLYLIISIPDLCLFRYLVNNTI